MNTILKTEAFDRWLKSLKDHVALAAILRRLTAAECGNFGQTAAIREGVSEMKINYGPGFRIYFMRQGDVVYLLLSGGNKRTQKKDIKNAIALAKDIRGNSK